jgi:hypothetical protein
MAEQNNAVKELVTEKPIVPNLPETNTSTEEVLLETFISEDNALPEIILENKIVETPKVKQGKEIPATVSRSNEVFEKKTTADGVDYISGLQGFIVLILICMIAFGISRLFKKS